MLQIVSLAVAFICVLLCEFLCLPHVCDYAVLILVSGSIFLTYRCQNMDLTIAEQVDYGHPVWPALRLDLPSVHARPYLLGESSHAKGMQ